MCIRDRTMSLHCLLRCEPPPTICSGLARPCKRASEDLIPEKKAPGSNRDIAGLHPRIRQLLARGETIFLSYASRSRCLRLGGPRVCHRTRQQRGRQESRQGSRHGIVGWVFLPGSRSGCFLGRLPDLHAQGQAVDDLLPVRQLLRLKKGLSLIHI